MPLPRLIRFGLRHFAAGMLSVLALGILNRVMKVELGIPLVLVGLMIGAHYFTAPLAIAAGHRSDFRPLFGLHRTPYILGGTLVTAVTTALAPLLAIYVGARDAAPPAIALGVFLFLVMGVGMYVSGTAYLALLSDLTPDHERGRAVAIVWSMLMLGILTGVFLGIVALDDYSQSRLLAMFWLMAGLVALLTTVAVWGQERRHASPPKQAGVPLRRAVALLARGRQARRFFLFLSSAILFLFLQQAILEPFGGDVFGLSVRQTTMFNAYMMVGVLAGMAIAGAWLAGRLGLRGTSALGLSLSLAAFALLATAAASRQLMLVQPAILLLGLGMGTFNVGGLALMMRMSTAGRVGLYMGTWTLAEALASGLATTGGGLLHEVSYVLLGTEARAYAAVFAVEAAGLLLTLLLLRGLGTASLSIEEEAAPSLVPSAAIARG